MPRLLRLAIAVRRLARLGGGLSVVGDESDPAESLRRCCGTLMRERGPIMRGGCPFRRLIGVSTRHLDGLGRYGCAFCRRGPRVLDGAALP